MAGSFHLSAQRDLKNPINQWLGIALIGTMCFWVVLYYLVNQTQTFGVALSQNPNTAYDAKLQGELSK